MAFAKFKVKKGIKTITEAGASEDVIPVGIIIPYGSSTAPPGWLMCDGTSTSGYTELAALVGATTPNLNESIIMGENQAPNLGSGDGTSGGSGPITGGATLATRTLNTAASTTNTSPQVIVAHSHGMQSHTHSTTHSHNYPHTHDFPHFHDLLHSHAVPSGGSPATAGSHAHTGFFGSANQNGPGTLGRNSNTQTTTALFGDYDGSHSHPIGAANVSMDPATTTISVGPNGDVAASATVDTASATTLTSSLGGSPSPSATFSIEQPTLRVYFIIKY